MFDEYGLNDTAVFTEEPIIFNLTSPLGSDTAPVGHPDAAPPLVPPVCGGRHPRQPQAATPRLHFQRLHPLVLRHA